jgi:hypothetical protein
MTKGRSAICANGYSFNLRAMHEQHAFAVGLEADLLE